MAIFYRWLKGYNDVSGQDSVTGVYSFLQWPIKSDFDGDSSTGGYAEDDISPKLYLTTSNTNDGASKRYVGRILLDREAAASNLYCQNIHLPWLFKNSAGIGCKLIQFFDDTATSINNSANSGANIKLSATGIQINEKNNELANINSTGIALNKGVTITGGLSTTGDIVSNNKIKGNSLDITTTATIKQSLEADSIKSSHLCEAEYFNATSDIRAKKDFSDYDFSDAFINDILAAICTYHFKKDKDTDPRFIGLVAQQVISICNKHDIDPRMFVYNMSATGLNGDYMSLNINNLMFLFAQGLKHTRQKQLELSMRLNILEEQING